MHLITRSCVLLLWMHALTFVKSKDCTLEQFLNSRHYDSNFDTTGLEASYVSGRQVRVGCNVGFSGFFELTCVEGRWQSRGTKCQPHQCPVIHVANNVQVNGDPEEATFGNVVRFSCKSSTELLLGQAELYCDESGQWNGEPPKCEAIKCTVPVIENGLVTGDDRDYNEHEVLHFACISKYTRAEDRPSKCMKIGTKAEWSPTPACRPIKCRLELSPGTRYEPAFRNVFSPGDTVRVTCGKKQFISEHQHQSAETTCRDDGKWTVEPVCKGFVGCETPPSLADGDTKYSIKSQYSHNEMVEYMCSTYYTMEGGPNRTCINGEWTGQLRCLKPCVVNEDELRRHNVTLKSTEKYFTHDEIIEFRCVSGTPVGAVAMRQRCNSGMILLPTCNEEL